MLCQGTFVAQLRCFFRSFHVCHVVQVSLSDDEVTGRKFGGLDGTVGAMELSPSGSISVTDHHEIASYINYQWQSAFPLCVIATLIIPRVIIELGMESDVFYLRPHLNSFELATRTIAVISQTSITANVYNVYSSESGNFYFNPFETGFIRARWRLGELKSRILSSRD